MPETPRGDLILPVPASRKVSDESLRLPPIHSFTPINGHTRATNWQEQAIQPFTPVSVRQHDGNTSGIFTVPRKQPTTDFDFEVMGRDLPGHFQADFHEISSAQAFKPRNTPAPDLRMTEALQVDKHDGRVWHLGHEPGESYSGIFANDDPDEMPLEVLHTISAMKDKINRTKRLEKSAELLQTSRALLEAGETLGLERTTFVEFGEPILCSRPACPYEGPNNGMPPNRYYLNLISKFEDYEATFCLACFEGLWNLKFTEGISDAPGLLHPDDPRRDSAYALPAQLDGTHEQHWSSSNEIFKSRHAIAEESFQGTISPAHTPDNRFATPGVESVEAGAEQWKSPNSTTSTGEWRYPPTRFQHIAWAIRPGVTLSPLDKAVVDLWKFTSRAQLRWEHQLARTRAIRDYYYPGGTATADLSLGMKPFIWDDVDGPAEGADVHVLEGPAHLRQKDCYGRDLSEVLKEAAQNK